MTLIASDAHSTGASVTSRVFCQWEGRASFIAAENGPFRHDFWPPGRVS
jgi:hypothetical protein